MKLKNTALIMGITVSGIVAGGVFIPTNAATFKFTVINNTGQEINDYHASISGTGSTIKNPKLLTPVDGGTIDSGQINPGLIGKLPSDIVIKFTKKIPDKGTFMFQFDTDFDQAKIEKQVFTVDGTPVPEPLTILGSATALGFGAFFKRKVKSSKSISKEIAKVG